MPDTVHIRADEIRDGKPFVRCLKCGRSKEINEFGLTRTESGQVSVRETCRACLDPHPEVVQIRVDSIRGGKLYKTCPHCGEEKEIAEFGLRRKTGAGKNGLDVVATQAWCRVCRPNGKA